MREAAPSEACSKAPYERKAGSWLRSLRECLSKASITPKVQNAIESWAALEMETCPRDWSTAQLGKEGGCARRTVDRNIPALLAAGLIEVTELGSHAIRKASLYRITRLLPSFQDQVASPSQRPDCPSPENLRFKTKSPSRPSKSANQANIPYTQAPVGEEHVAPSLWEGFREGILEALTSLGKVSPKGFLSAEKVSTLPGEQAIQVAKAAARLAPTRAKRNPIGWALTALRDSAFGLSLVADLDQIQEPVTTWGEETAEVVAQLQAIPADPAGIQVARSKTWCDGPTALRVLVACLAYWSKGNHQNNPGGFAIQALISRALGESMLAEAGEATVLGVAIQKLRELERDGRQFRKLHPEEPWMNQRAAREAAMDLSRALAQVLPAQALAAGIQEQATWYGVQAGWPIPRFMEIQGAIRAGLKAGLISGWDMQAFIEPGHESGHAASA